jgi:hypothetical protein
MQQTRPDLSRFREIPAFSQWRQRDMLEQIANDLRNHDMGYFYNSATLVDEMMTDDRISGVLGTRIGGFLSVPTTFRPAGPKRKAAKLAEVLGGPDENEDDGIWSDILSQEAAREILKWRIMLGVSIAEIVWVTTESTWTPRIIPVHPRHLRWDWTRNQFCMVMWEPYSVIWLPDTQHEVASDGKWIVWGGLRSWMNGAVRSLALKYLGRTWNERDWARYNEKHGLPMMKGKVPSSSDADDKAAFENDLNNIGSEPTVICPQGATTTDASFDVELIEPKSASTGETFPALKSAIDTDIAILLLGQNLTTEAGSAGTGGSRAMGQVQNLVRLDKKKEDAELYRVVRRQCLSWWAGYGYQDASLAPYPKAEIDPPDDELSEAQVMQALGAAALPLKTANPLTDLETIWESFGIPQLEEGDPKAVAPAQPSGPGGGQSNAPGFHAFGADGQHVSGPHVTKDEAKAAGQKAAGGGPVVIKQQGGDDAKTKPNDSKETKLVALRSSVSRRKERYNDALTRLGAKRAAAALGPMLEQINGAIGAAKDPKDLKRRLVALYRQSDTTELAKVFERTNILAHMAGRDDLLKEI